MDSIFLAGPMFSSADTAGQARIKSVMEKAGFETYLAQIEGIEIRPLIQAMLAPSNQSPELLKAALLLQKIGWCHEMFRLLTSDGLILNMNGRVPDEGSVSEAATAFTAGIPVVIFKDTTITMWGEFDNPMVAALSSDWEHQAKLSKLPAAMAEAIKDQVAYTYKPPRHLRDAVAFGKIVAADRDAIVAALKVAAVDLPAALSKFGTDLSSMKKFIKALLAP